MTELIVNVEESKVKFITKLLREFDYVSVKRKKKSHTAENKRILDNISAAVQEFKQFKRGEVELIDASAYIEELKKEGYL